MSAMTPYKAAKLVNEEIIVPAGFKAIPPQMLYNYTLGRIADGKTPKIPVDSDRKVDSEDALGWAREYIAKKQNVQVQQTPGPVSGRAALIALTSK
jgi:hypothetical protein